jgi:hypothetical protein
MPRDAGAVPGREPGLTGVPVTPRDDDQTPSQRIPITLNQTTQLLSTVNAPASALWQALNRHHQRLMKSRG